MSSSLNLSKKPERSQGVWKYPVPYRQSGFLSREFRRTQGSTNGQFQQTVSHRKKEPAVSGKSETKDSKSQPIHRLVSRDKAKTMKAKRAANVKPQTIKRLNHTQRQRKTRSLAFPDFSSTEVPERLRLIPTPASLPQKFWRG